jgi:hypothetical protein
MPGSEENFEVVGEFDLTPAPRTLAMLGEITFSQVQCLAEFIDNSIDGFLKAQRNNAAISHPNITIDLPSTNNTAARITISDNGPGMTHETLQNALRVGWSGNNPHDNLGLFGMGFNIAMARLSHCATIWTTTKEDEFWHGTEVNIRDMISANHCKTQHRRRPKHRPGESGTEIVITEIKSEQLDWFCKTNNKTNVRNKLAEIYSAYLRDEGGPISFNLIMGPNATPIKKHCVWGNPEDGSEERLVPFKGLQVNAYQLVNETLESRKYCDTCWVWLKEELDQCTLCKSEKNVSLRKRKIHGWLGVQRFCDKNNYGIDFIRNGRKIETRNKDLFSWEHPQDGIIDEYPIEDLRIGGRIVGEIHLDHCKVPYTKDKFVRSDPHWDEMIKVLRGEGPLLPRKRTHYGFGENHTQLYKLVRAFRRAVPQSTSLSPGSYLNVLGIKDNRKALEYAKQFSRDNLEYKSDEKWYQVILEQEQEIGGIDDGEDDPIDGDDPPIDGDDPPIDGDDPPIDGDDVPPRHLVPSLSKKYRSDMVSTSWEVNAYTVEGDDPLLENDKPWVFLFEQSKWYFYFNPGHEVFNSKTLQPSDALLAIISNKAALETEFPEASFADAFFDLRTRYDPNKLDGSQISASARELLDNICKGFSGHTDKEENTALFKELDDESKTKIAEKTAQRNIILDHAIENGDFLQYCERKTLLDFFEKNPELYFDGKFWALEYSALNTGNRGIGDVDLQRKEILKEYRGLMQDVVWLENEGPNVVEQSPRGRLLKALYSIDLLKARLA